MIIYGSGKTGRIHRNVQPDYRAEELEQRKTCNRCGRVLPITEYSKCKKMKSGRNNTCKKCVAEKERKRLERKRRLEQAPTDGSKVCRVCGVEKPFSEFYMGSGVRSSTPDCTCKECRKKAQRDAYRKKQEKKDER